ncbi:hypothetical protein HTV45_19715 [Streptomyces sp. CHD11]|uniref:hypothetical protein n=1 Tax=Streptomyces sp. CHD11 TaxID=2741325 RepID=UPI001BFC791C|nr:hypothetical protein [Streptomyces sp. CHD11]MBT3153067.1 hypothetical protein [Streptomyces sp. CHD11]
MHDDQHAHWFGRQTEAAIEWRHITRRLDTLYAAQFAGDTSVLTAQRIRQYEALQMALCGSPEALAQATP